MAKALMVSLVMVVFGELIDCSAQRVLTKEDHAIQAVFLDRMHEPLGVSVQIRWPWRKTYGCDACILEQLTKSFGVDAVTIENRVPDVHKKTVEGVGHIAANLPDPFPVRVLRNACNVHPLALQLHKEEHVVPGKPYPRPDLHG